MRLLLTTLIGAFIASLLGKILADAFLSSSVDLFWGIRLEYAQNPGIAFGLRLPETLQPLLIIIAIIILLAVALRSTHTRVSAAGFGLILGGALGNIVDRSFDGYVTDFIGVGWFPIFNFADSAISIGVALLLVESLWTEVRKYRQKRAMGV